MSASNPQNFLRRSLLYREHQKLGAQFANYHGQMVVANYAKTDHNASHDPLCRMALCDFSTIARAGYKGFNTPMWLGTNGVTIPSQANLACVHLDHTLIARLSKDEHLFLTNPIANLDQLQTTRQSDKSLATNASMSASTDTSTGDTLVDDLKQKYAHNVDGVYHMPRADSHAWLYLCGQYAAEMMSHLCAVDLRPESFKRFEVAQTSVARINAILIRQDLDCAVGFHLLCDSASVEYLWGVLATTASLNKGIPVGLNAFAGRTFVIDSVQ